MNFGNRNSVKLFFYKLHITKL